MGGYEFIHDIDTVAVIRIYHLFVLKKHKISSAIKFSSD